MSNGAIVYRSIGGLLTMLAIMVYAFFIYLGYIEWKQNLYIHESKNDELWFLIGAVFGSGLPPLIVAATFFFKLDSIGGLLAGCGMTIIFIVFHFITLNFMAHGSPFNYIPFALFELLLAVWAALTKLKPKEQSATNHQQSKGAGSN